MSLFKEAKNESAYLKVGIYGGNGAGKSRTAAEIAIGLHKYMKADKPVYYKDSETGSDYLIPLFKKHNVPLCVSKSRSFSDLLLALDEAEENAFLLITDSITHYWDNLVESYKKKHDLTRLTIQHWGEIKPIWWDFSKRYVTSNLHIIVCGRAGDVWQDVEDEEGFKELKKVGTKMRVEKELGYEPSLLIEMEKHRQSAKVGAGWTHRAWVVKDRFDVIDSQHFDNPTFESFLPHIELLNLGGEHRAVDEGGDTQELFSNSHNGYNRKVEKDITLEKIQEELKIAYPSRKDEDVKGRSDLMFQVFGTRSWTEIEKRKAQVELEQGLLDLQNYNNQEDFKKQVEDEDKKSKKGGK